MPIQTWPNFKRDYDAWRAKARMPEFESVKDSGERQQFDSGAVRDTQTGKGRYDLLPPHFLHRLARHYENGAVKYDDRNWEKGMPASRCLDSALRHLFSWLGGARDEDHLAAAAWNIAAIIHFEEQVAAGKADPSLFEGIPGGSS
jgi:hypothetical protein